MQKITLIICTLVLCFSSISNVKAGNKDRQGEAGAYELLVNPWARSAGLNGLVAANVTGIDAIRYNPAGLARLRGTEVGLSHTQYLLGTGINLNAVGIAQSVSTNGTVGIAFNSMTFGDINLTTVNNPEGIGTFSPTFFNLALSYGHSFKDKEGNEKVAVGFTVRTINESINDVSATGVCFDAGIQYTTGARRQLKLGLVVRNIGTKMKFTGAGLSFIGISPDGGNDFTVNGRSASFELPSLLHISVSYDFKLGAKDDFTLIGNFISNSFSRDQYGLGAEYTHNKMFSGRLGYKYEADMYASEGSGTMHQGLTGGFSVNVPFKKDSDKTFGLDYAYGLTKEFGGNHSIGLRVKI